MKTLLVALLALFIAVPAQAQVNSNVATRCTAAAAGNITVVSGTIVIASQTTGGIFICGYILNAGAFNTLTTATLGYTTASSTQFLTATNQATLTPGIAFVSLTQGFPLSTTLAGGFPVVQDESSAYRGLYVPPGNNVAIWSTQTATMGYTIYYFPERQ